MSERWQWAIGVGAALVSSTGRRLLSVDPGGVWNVTPQEERLIAAAPEMLELLRELAEDYWRSTDCDDDRWNCRHAQAAALLRRIEGDT